MTSIGNTLYNNALNSYTSLTSLADTLTTKDKENTQETTTAGSSGDTVSLSPQVSIAQAREYLGLAPTGRLTLSDIQSAAEKQKESVRTMLAEAMEDLGIDPDQQVSLSRSKDGSVAIAETFTGKKELQKLLNSDGDFLQAFTGLSSNNEVLDYTKSLQTSSASLADYLTGTSGETDLLSLGAKYSALKSSNGLDALWRLSHSETPYTFVYNEA